MAGNKALQDALKAGIEAARRGDRVTARRLLRQVVTADANHEAAWLWLASAAENLEERRECLENTLRINPNNTRAREALDRLGTGRADYSRSTAQSPAQITQRRVNQANAVTEGRNPVIGYAIVVAVVIALLVGIVMIASAILGQPAQPNRETEVAFQRSLVTSTPVATADPRTFTETPFVGVLVAAPSNAPTLPPTFTPTYTPTATETPLPTVTPYPVAIFTLLYSAFNSGDSQPALYRSDGEGVGEFQLGASSDGFRDVAFHPGGEQIAFVRVVTYTNDAGEEVTAPELFIANLTDIAGARQVTRLGSDVLSNPTWAPDGIQLVFVSNLDGDEELWYVTEDGNNLRQLTFNDWRDTDPAWSPDGTRIVFASEQSNRPGSGLLEIFSMTMGGDEPVFTQMTDAEGSSYEPAWSPNGALIVFASDRNDDGDIFVMDADGQRPFLLTPDDGGAEDHSPVFVPDGENIVFASNQDGGNFGLVMVDLRGNLRLRLANTGHVDFQSIAFRPEILLRLGQ
ncbi:MAG: PD40 domain-containing protein [Anaerolineaceae bacterium]|nr:PD40 domain-containing protein [Anaerolineaceae bacterium]